MKNLSDHNKDITAHYKLMRETDHLAGVVCDTCGIELHYSEPGRVNDSYPASNWVFCDNSECLDYKVRQLKTV